MCETNDFSKRRLAEFIAVRLSARRAEHAEKRGARSNADIRTPLGAAMDAAGARITAEPGQQEAPLTEDRGGYTR
jgi:hypothetical protein